MNSFFKSSIRIGILYLFLVGSGFALIYAVHLIPFQSIKKNVDKSCEIIGREKYYNVLYYDYGFHLNIHRGNMNYCLDGHTDAWMLMETCNVKKENHIRASMANDRMQLKDGQLPFDVVTGYSSKLNDKDVILYNYGRYWHGYLITLIPALMFMDLSQIRTLNCIIFSLLIIAICFLSYKRTNLATPIAFIIPLAFGLFFPIVPYSLQYSSVFYIAFVSSIVLLIFNKYWLLESRIWGFFFIVGALTSYFDFLTAPIVTLGFPLTFYGLLKKNPNIRELFMLCMIWAIGYGLMWSSKWILAYFLAGVNVFEETYSHAAIWTGADGNGGSILHFLSHLVVNAPFFNNILMGLIILGIIIPPKKNGETHRNLWLLFIASIPVVWLFIMRQHTMIHYYFSWRNLLVSFFALLLFCYKITDFSRIKIFSNNISK